MTTEFSFFGELSFKSKTFTLYYLYFLPEYNRATVCSLFTEEAVGKEKPEGVADVVLNAPHTGRM